MPSRPIDDLREEMREKRLHPTWRDRWNRRVYYPLYRFWNDYNPRQLYREARWFLQRGKRGWADKDIWSLDWYLAGWLPDALLKLKKTKQGIPSAVFEAEDCDEHGNPSDAGMKRAEDRWNAIMDSMIAGFEAYKRAKDWAYDDKLGPYPLYRPEGVSKEEWKAKKDARFEQFQELARQDEAVFQRGMELFIQYWPNLWD